MSVEIISAWGEPTGRHAEIIRTEKGYEVNLFKGNEYLRNIKLHNYSESYAESCAENYVLGIVNYESGT